MCVCRLRALGCGPAIHHATLHPLAHQPTHAALRLDPLQDKSPLVEELEDALLELCEGRAAAMERRRAAGDAEAHSPAEAAVAAAMAVLSRGGAQSAAATAAEVAAEAAEEKLLGLDLPVELDEFGRDMNAEKKAELADR